MNNWVIWSEEHLAWWRPDSCGYTGSLRQAGRYTEAEAKAIERNANSGGRTFCEVALPLPDNFDKMIEKPTRR